MEKKKRFWITIGCIAGAAAAGYFGTAVYFVSHFPYHAAVDGIDVSGMTLEEAGHALAGRTSDYTLTLTGRGGLTDTIAAEDIDLSMDMAQGELETLLRGRSPLRWPEALLRPVSYTSTAAAVCDEEKLTKKIDALTFFDPQHITAPKDAEVALSGDRLTVVPEQEGTEPDREKVQEAIRIAVSYLTPSLNLDTAGLYREPQRRADDAALTAQADAENRILDEFPALRFGDQEERPGAEELLSWIGYENGTADIRQDKIAAYVSDLAEKYDTVGKKRSFTDPGSHRAVTVEPGTFGWELDQEATAEELTAAIAADGMKKTVSDASDGGETAAAGTDAAVSVDTADTEQRIETGTGTGSEEGSFPVLDPVWKQEGKEHGDQDWGKDYVAVDLDNQHVYVVQNDKVVLDSDCVSGKAVVGHSTPDGIFYIFAMAKDAVLKGDGYASPVKNWMPFYRGVGFHDATWRSRFGGKIYITSGSHGCVNLPLSFATKLYDLVEVGTPVLVYGGMSQEDAAEAGYHIYDDHTPSDAGNTPAQNGQTPAAAADPNAAIAAAQSARAAAEAANQALANAQAGGDPVAIAAAQAQAAQAATAAAQAQAAAQAAAEAAQSASQPQAAQNQASQAAPQAAQNQAAQAVHQSQ